MSDAREFVFEGPFTRDELADLVTRVAAGIRAGGLSISMGDDELTVFPRGDLALEVVARTKKDRSRLDVAIGWRQPGDDGPAGPPAAAMPQDALVVGAGPAAEETGRWETRRGSYSKGRPRQQRRPTS